MDSWYLVILSFFCQCRIFQCKAENFQEFQSLSAHPLRNLWCQEYQMTLRSLHWDCQSFQQQLFYTQWHPPWRNWQFQSNSPWSWYLFSVYRLLSWSPLCHLKWNRCLGGSWRTRLGRSLQLFWCPGIGIFHWIGLFPCLRHTHLYSCFSVCNFHWSLFPECQSHTHHRSSSHSLRNRLRLHFQSHRWVEILSCRHSFLPQLDTSYLSLCSGRLSLQYLRW